MYSNPAKVFNYDFQIQGVTKLLIQDVDIPELSFEEAVHGTAGNVPNMKTPGKPVIGDLTLESVIPANEADVQAEAWYALALTGVPELYTRTGFLRRLDASRQPIETWLLKEVWVKSIKHSNFNSVASDNQTKTLILSVNQMIPVAIPDFNDFWEQAL